MKWTELKSSYEQGRLTKGMLQFGKSYCVCWLDNSVAGLDTSTSNVLMYLHISKFILFNLNGLF